MRLFLISITLTLISTSLTGQNESQQQIPSTNVFMDAPEGFANSENFKGFQKPSDPYSMIMVTEMPAPFHEITKGFTDELMSARGMTLIKKEEKRMGVDDGLYVEMLQEANGVVFKKAILVFGDDDKTTFINGMCLEEDHETFESIARSVHESTLQTDIVIDQRAELDFMVNEEGLDLQFIGVVANGMLFNRDGQMPTESEDQLNIIFDKSYAEVNATDKEKFCLTRLAQLPGKYQYDEDAGISTIEIDGLEGRSLVAINTEGEKIHQVILFIPTGGYYIFAAMHIDVAQKAQDDAEKLLKTFKRN